MHSRTRSYGMQNRSMHTASHHVFICRDRKIARGLERYSKKREMFPVEPIDACVADIEIHFRHPPVEHRDNKLVIVNSGAVIPNVFG